MKFDLTGIVETIQRQIRKIRRRLRTRPSGSRGRRSEVQRQKQRIRIAVYVVLAIIVILIIVLIVSCSSCVKRSAEKKAIKESGLTIPEEYVEATLSRDSIEVSDEVPTASTDSETYTLYVNTALNVVTVYRTDGMTAVRAFECSTGEFGTETPEVDLTLTADWYTDWHDMADDTFSQYAYRLSDYSTFFRSVPYTNTDKSTLITDDYNMLGSSITAGSIYISVADAIYIGTHCGEGTLVHIYSDADETIPVTVDEAYVIPTEIEELAGWDPTDPDSSNPWHSYTFTFEIPNSISVKTGSSEAILEAIFNMNVSSEDMYGNNLNNYASFTGTYDLNKPSYYQLDAKLSVGPVHADKTVILVVSDSAEEVETEEVPTVEK